MKIITWVDLQGRYRVTSPAYNDSSRPVGETEDELILRVWAKIKVNPKYQLPPDHPYHVVDNDELKARVLECCGVHFRYPPNMTRADRDSNNEVKPEVINKFAWEMDTDGSPKVNMPKARGIQMDCIRLVRNQELVKLDISYMRALESSDTQEQTRIAGLKQTLRDVPQTFDLTTLNDTPAELEVMWPVELPKNEE